MEIIESNYSKYRGKCKEECEKLILTNPDLRLVRGFYYEPWWDRKEQHFWCEDKDGNIIDPTGLQFPTGGGNTFKSFYREFDGIVLCEECGKEMLEEDVIMQGRYPVCSTRCACKLVGL